MDHPNRKNNISCWSLLKNCSLVLYISKETTSVAKATLVEVHAHIKAQKEGKEVELSCAIGDEEIDGRPYSEVVEIAREYIENLGGFEELAKWGLI